MLAADEQSMCARPATAERCLPWGFLFTCSLAINAAAGRKQGDEAPEVFRAVMEQIAEALIAAAAALLSPAAQASGLHQGLHHGGVKSGDMFGVCVRGLFL